MDESDILANLCWNDPRNPNFPDRHDGDENPEPRVDCHCDPCFYGRDKLALEILRLREIEKAARAYTVATAANGSTCYLALTRALNPKEADHGA